MTKPNFDMEAALAQLREGKGRQEPCWSATTPD